LGRPEEPPQRHVIVPLAVRLSDGMALPAVHLRFQRLELQQPSPLRERARACCAAGPRRFSRLIRRAALTHPRRGLGVEVPLDVAFVALYLAPDGSVAGSRNNSDRVGASFRAQISICPRM